MSIKRGITLLVLLSFSIVNVVHAEAKAGARFLKAQVSSDPSKAEFKMLYDGELGGERYFKDEVIIKFKPGITKAEMKKYLIENNLEFVEKLTPTRTVCRVKEDPKLDAKARMSIEPMLAILNKKDDIVEDIDINEYKELSTDGKAGKPEWSYAKSVDTDYKSQEWHLDFISGTLNSIDTLWSTYNRGSGVKVAVIDTGFDATHPDINWDGTGYDAVRNVVGATAPAAPITSAENHGTSVAAIISGKDDNSGVIGVAPDATIIPIRLLPASGMVSLTTIVRAHTKAVELGAKIINNSWGSTSKTSLSTTETELYRTLRETNDVLVIFAAGNSGASTMLRAPEARCPYVMGVGSLSRTGLKTSYSVYGAELDIVAPGGDASGYIITADRRDRTVTQGRTTRTVRVGYALGNHFTRFQGTSAAAPVVAGIAALIRAQNSSLTAQQVHDLITSSANRSFHANYTFDADNHLNPVGYGLIDANAALQAAGG